MAKGKSGKEGEGKAKMYADRVCHRCGRKGHMVKNCTTPSSDPLWNVSFVFFSSLFFFLFAKTLPIPLFQEAYLVIENDLKFDMRVSGVDEKVIL